MQVNYYQRTESKKTKRDVAASNENFFDPTVYQNFREQYSRICLPAEVSRRPQRLLTERQLLKVTTKGRSVTVLRVPPAIRPMKIDMV